MGAVPGWLTVLKDTCSLVSVIGVDFSGIQRALRPRRGFQGERGEVVREYWMLAEAQLLSHIFSLLHLDRQRTCLVRLCWPFARSRKPYTRHYVTRSLVQRTGCYTMLRVASF